MACFMGSLYHGKEKKMYTWAKPSITAILSINTPETIAHDAILLATAFYVQLPLLGKASYAARVHILF